MKTLQHPENLTESEKDQKSRKAKIGQTLAQDSSNLVKVQKI